jgi:hypothetical protein
VKPSLLPTPPLSFLSCSPELAEEVHVLDQHLVRDQQAVHLDHLRRERWEGREERDELDARLQMNEAVI